jgi:hypothetical protein
VKQWTVLLIAVVVLVVVWSRRVSARGNQTWDRAPGFFALADAIATAEGYGVPGAIPTVRNNPGDLKLAGSVVTSFDSPESGWDALYHQLDLIRTGQSAYYRPDMTLAELAQTWTATEQDFWLANVVHSLQAQGYTVGNDSRLVEVFS